MAKSNDQLQISKKGYIRFNEKSSSVDLSLLDAGYYSVQYEHTPFGSIPYINKEEKPTYPESTKKLIPFYIPDHKLIKTFFNPSISHLHKSMSISHKLNLLLAGKHGSGKTSVAYEYINEFVKDMGAICIEVSNIDEFKYSESFIKQYHKDIDSTQIFIRMFDESEECLKYSEAHMKMLLDSNKSVENTMTIFTTNYLDMIPDAIKDRKSRIKFKYVIDGINDPEIVTLSMRELNASLEEDDRVEDSFILDVVNNLFFDKEGNANGHSMTLDEIKHEFTDRLITAEMEFLSSDIS